MRRLSKRDRLLGAIAGHAVDRPPVALWRHWPVDDQEPTLLARATIAFQELYDFDFIKVSPSSSYCIRDWGAVDSWQGHYHGTREYGARVIREPGDWRLLKLLNPQSGALGALLDALRQIRERVGQAVPIIQTVFSPLSQAKNLAGEETLLAHLRTAPEEVEAGLQIIEETTARFMGAALEDGIDGVFYAIQHLQAHLLSAEEYRRFAVPQDLRLLDVASKGWLNVLHLHGENILFDLPSEYPVQVVNWHDRETSLSLAQGKTLFKGAVCGGIRQEQTLVLGTPEDVEAEVLDAIEQTDGRRLVIGTGCVTPTTAPYGNLRAARQAVELVS